LFPSRTLFSCQGSPDLPYRRAVLYRRPQGLSSTFSGGPPGLPHAPGLPGDTAEAHSTPPPTPPASAADPRRRKVQRPRWTKSSGTAGAAELRGCGEGARPTTARGHGVRRRRPHRGHHEPGQRAGRPALPGDGNSNGSRVLL